MLADHPQIECAMRTGYPSWNQPDRHYCQNCGKDITDEDIYADGAHDFLCRSCLLILHEKTWW